jgi:hypothetical protein
VERVLVCSEGVPRGVEAFQEALLKGGLGAEREENQFLSGGNGDQSA